VSIVNFGSDGGILWLVLLDELVVTSRAVADTRSRRDKAGRLAELLRRLAPEERVPAIAWLCGELTQGKIGAGWAALRDLGASPAALEPTLQVAEVEGTFSALASASGAGSVNLRKRLLGELWTRATAQERDFLARVMRGELRQGGLDGVMAEGAALAAGVDVALLRRAWMLAGNLPTVAAAALAEGAPALARFELALFTPVLPMLASPTDGVEAAMARLGTAALEDKLDGARVQVHKDGELVRVFTRGLLEVTAQVPDVVEAALALPARRLVLDGEAIALRSPGGPPLPFQETMSRFARKVDVAARRAQTPLSVFFFDALRIDEATWLDRPARERFAALDALVPPAQRVPRLVTADVAEAERFLAAALARGHEGVMAKALDAPYQVGARGQSWLKLKKAHTLDLVVLAVERGSGRRSAWLSNIHLGARDPAGGFVMLGKTFKGMTDEMLVWQTEHFATLVTADDGWVVHLRPEQVVEIAFDGVQQSTQYPGGFALRFARVKRYRSDKRAADADTIDTVRAIFAADRARGG
jgi:DNA ligase-1